jgi:hypothetical protein
MVRLLLGTQWYILFNVIAGATAIPSHRPIEVIRGYEAEAADAYACAFTGFVRLERHLMNREMAVTGGLCGLSAKV